MTQKQYHIEVHKEIADLYLIDRLSIPKACAKVGISPRSYYKICKKLNVPSIVTKKDGRLDYISSDSDKNNFDAYNIDEHNSAH